jgi:hypothetical protein
MPTGPTPDQVTKLREVVPIAGLEAAALAIKVCRSTLYRWAAVHTTKGGLYQEVHDILEAAVSAAVLLLLLLPFQLPPHPLTDEAAAN